MDTQRKTGLKITLLIISLSQLGSMAISSVISEILEAFPDVPDQTVQFLMTFPGLFTLITSLLSAFLARYISQKKACSDWPYPKYGDCNRRISFLREYCHTVLLGGSAWLGDRNVDAAGKCHRVRSF